MLWRYLTHLLSTPSHLGTQHHHILTAGPVSVYGTIDHLKLRYIVCAQKLTLSTSLLMLKLSVENTLTMLFSAQKNTQAPPKLSQAPVPPAVAPDHRQQASLHSFWNLPSRPSSCGSSTASTSPPPPANIFQATNCEECDVALVSVDGDAMDTDMDIDMCGSTEYGCSRCGKQVCHRCTVSNLGADRTCLICAGKRTWVGGIGWMDQD